jgi:mRNA interferase MazF
VYVTRNNVTVVPITRSIRGIDTEVRLSTTDGMPQECVANLDDITTIPKELLTSHITSLSGQRMSQVEVALHYALDLST